MQFSSVLSDNISHLHSLLDVGTNFDVVYRTARVGGRDACLYFVDGFTKDEVLLKILQAWSSIKPEAMPSDVHEFSKQYVPYGEVDLPDTEDSVITLLLSGITCVFIDGYGHRLPHLSGQRCIRTRKRQGHAGFQRWLRRDPDLQYRTDPPEDP